MRPLIGGERPNIVQHVGVKIESIYHNTSHCAHQRVTARFADSPDYSGIYAGGCAHGTGFMWRHPYGNTPTTSAQAAIPAHLRIISHHILMSFFAAPGSRPRLERCHRVTRSRLATGRGFLAIQLPTRIFNSRRQYSRDRFRPVSVCASVRVSAKREAEISSPYFDFFASPDRNLHSPAVAAFLLHSSRE